MISTETIVKETTYDPIPDLGFIRRHLDAEFVEMGATINYDPTVIALLIAKLDRIARALTVQPAASRCIPVARHEGCASGREARHPRHPHSRWLRASRVRSWRGSG